MSSIEEINDIQQTYEKQKTLFKNAFDRTEMKVRISDHIIKNQPVPIIYLNNFNLIKYTGAKCQTCNKQCNYMLLDKYFCDKHIHKELVVTNVLNKS